MNIAKPIIEIYLPNLIDKGGITMIPLIFCSILGLSIIIERLFYWFIFIKIKKQSPLVSSSQRGLLTLETLAAISPLLGILGTVIGIMDCFSSLGPSTKEGMELLSAGISTALITTAYGLVTAIICLVSYNFFSFLAERAQELLYASLKDKENKTNEAF